MNQKAIHIHSKLIYHPNNLFDVESGWYTNKELKNKANNVLLFWLKLFHEAEYKRSTLIKYGISTTTCDYIINGVWKMFINVYDFAMNKWLIIHSMKNKYFHFGRDVFEPNELDSWYKIFNRAGMWFGSQDIDDETIRPEIYDWPGNSIENNEVATEIVNSYNNLVKAKTIKEKIISTTIALNTMHHTGELVTMSGLLDEDKLNYLSNLPKKPWDGELYKEFGIKIS